MRDGVGPELKVQLGDAEVDASAGDRRQGACAYGALVCSEVESEALLIEGGGGELRRLESGDEPRGCPGKPWDAVHAPQPFDRFRLVRRPARLAVPERDAADEPLACSDTRGALLFAVCERDPAGVEAKRLGEEHEALAAAGIDALEAFIAEIGLPTKLSEMGIEGEGTDEMLRAVADSTIIIPSCPKVLDADEVYEILEACK